MLIVYDGWQKRSLAGVVAVIVGPVLAIFLSHIFAAALAHRVTTGKRLSARERRAVLVKESRFLLIAVPPLGCGNGGLDWRIVLYSLACAMAIDA